MRQESEYRCDVLVIGSGASGMSTAITAASKGLKVLVIEKEPSCDSENNAEAPLVIAGAWLTINEEENGAEALPPNPAAGM